MIKIENIFKNSLIKYCVFVFLFFMIISLLMPYGGDDWNNLLDGATGNLSNIISIAISDYMTWEGRFFSRICLGFFVPKQIIWSILNAFIMTFMFYTFVKIIKPKNNLIISLLLLGILLVDFETFSQVYVWKTGNITYLFPMLYLCLLLFLRENNFTEKLKKEKWYMFLFMPLLALPFCMFVENVSVVIIVICTTFLIYNFIKYKKIDLLMLFCLLFSALGFLLMICSPGTAVRMGSENDFNSLSVIGKFIYNIPNLIQYTYLKNSVLIIFLVIVLVLLIKKFINRSSFRIVLFLFISIIPLITSLVNVLTFLVDDNIRYVWRFLDSNRWYIILYWCMFTLILLYFVIRYAKEEKNVKIIIFLIFALSSNGSMMMSPVWGGRTAFLTTIMLLLVVILIINDFVDKFKFVKQEKIFINFIIGLFTLVFLIYSIYCYNLSSLRDKYIKYQINHNYNEIEVIIIPAYYTWNMTPWGDGFTAQKFKSYMGIDQDTKLIMVRKNDVIKKIKSKNIE